MQGSTAPATHVHSLTLNLVRAADRENCPVTLSQDHPLCGQQVTVQSL